MGRVQIWIPVTNVAFCPLLGHCECSFGSTLLEFLKNHYVNMPFNADELGFVWFVPQLRVTAEICVTKCSHNHPACLQLTTDNFSHAAGGINTAYVFWMGGVGVVAEQESCAEETWKLKSAAEQRRSKQATSVCETHCAGWWACGKRCGWCRSGPGNTGCCCW